MHGSHSHPPGRGHNAASGVVQWQTPHDDHAAPHPHERAQPDTEKDLDLVAQAFAQGFAATDDPTSFLRLAGIPFEAKTADGKRIVLLRVEREQIADVGSVTPQVGGGDFRYAPLPARLAGRRDTLTFAYFDGDNVVRLDFVAARALTPA
ncbi:MAG: hypothetical protein AAFV26_00530 [Pseudomonadota bacterium]